jgi:hypothetical protein
MPRGEQGADLEQGLSVARGEFVEDETPGLVVECPEHVRHTFMIGKRLLAYQASAAERPVRFR